MPRLSVSPKQIDDFRQYLHLQLTSAASDQAEIDRALDGILTAAPGGLPFSDHQRRVIQAGMEARSAFEEFEKTVKLFSACIVQSTSRMQILESSNSCVVLSRQMIASARYGLGKTYGVVTAAREMIME